MNLVKDIEFRKKRIFLFIKIKKGEEGERRKKKGEQEIGIKGQRDGKRGERKRMIGMGGRREEWGQGLGRFDLVDMQRRLLCSQILMLR